MHRTLDAVQRWLPISLQQVYPFSLLPPIFLLDSLPKVLLSRLEQLLQILQLVDLQKQWFLELIGVLLLALQYISLQPIPNSSVQNHRLQLLQDAQAIDPL